MTSNQDEYKKKCSRCDNEILMRLAAGSGKWQALETDGSMPHKCIPQLRKYRLSKEKSGITI